MNGTGAFIDGGMPALAIVGLAFEFPDDATSSAKFWEMLCDGRSASTDFPRDRLNVDSFYHPDPDRPASIPLRGGHFVKENLGAFDAPFFSITPAEAACMDPQHRRMLEVSYHALENAGIPMQQCVGSDTAVYTGCFTNDYLSILQQDLEAEQRHAIMGIAPSMLANRVSWFYNFKGTSMNLDSACSSSLVALHLACQDLKAGNCSMAMVGGANLVYHPNFMKMMTDFNFLSKDSRSWSFDSRANGYARGEGHAVLIVKRLSDAVRNGDTIRAVIRNTGSNQDGRTPGITQPSGDSQRDLIRRTYEQAGLDMTPTRFFEAHGTGTPVGDPIEANAIGSAFCQYRSPQDPLYIGAVKANIGHLEGCSGLAGVIKTVLVLENGYIPPIAGLVSPNPEIRADKFHLCFPKDGVPWPVQSARRACVNSFGFGGTNATVILDDAYFFLQSHGLRGFHQTRAPSLAPSITELAFSDEEPNHKCLPTPKLLVWSAPEKNGAQRLITQYSDFLADQFNDWASLSYTLASRRTHFSWRSFAVTPAKASKVADRITTRPPIKKTEDARVAYIFTGQGAQYKGMGRELLPFSAFSHSLMESDKHLSGLECTWSVLESLRGGNESSAMESPEYGQTLTTCLQIALVDLLRSFGLIPSVVLGHSSGEIAAAYTCGAISHRSAVRVAYHRGILSTRLSKMEAHPVMAMMVVGLSRQDVNSYLERLANEHSVTTGVQIGCVNSPRSVTVTGLWSELSTIETWLTRDGVFTRRLQVPVAYHHSRYMSEVAAEYLELIGNLEQQPAGQCIPMISSVTGDVAQDNALREGRYWVQNLTSTVEFEKAFTQLAIESGKRPRHRLGKRWAAPPRATHVLEIGPHSTLKGPIRDVIQHLTEISHQTPSLTYIPSLVRQHDAAESLLHSVGELWCVGVTSINILRACNLRPGSLATMPGLPSYPFDHTQLHWKEGRLSKNLRLRDTPRHDLLGTRSLDWNSQVAQWRNIIRLAEVPWLEDHTIAGQIVFPAAGMVAIAIEALKQLHGSQPLRGVLIRDVSFSHAIAFSSGADQVEVQLTMLGPRSGRQDEESEFRLSVIENDEYIECCRGNIRPVTGRTDQNRVISSGPWRTEMSAAKWSRHVREACLELEEDIYSVQEDGAIRYGPSFQNLKHVRFGAAGEATGQLNAANWRSKGRESLQCSLYTVHPSTLDGLAQLLVPAISKQRQDETLPTMMPTHIQTLWVQNSPVVREEQLEVVAKFGFRGYRGATGHIAAFGKDPDHPLVILNGLDATFIGSEASESSRLGDDVRAICHRLTSRPHPGLITHGQMRAYCTRDRPKETEGTIEMRQRKYVALIYFIEHALACVEHYSPHIAGSHFESYVGWMEYQAQRLIQCTISIDHTILKCLHRDPEQLELFLASIERADVEGRLLVSLGRNLVNILSKQSDPLELMFGEGLLHQYYEEMLASDHHAYPAEQFIDLLSHDNPSMKILEIGAGTGAITLRLLEEMNADGILKCDKYDYTDISPAFFHSAQLKLSDYCHAMDFRVCNIGIDPITQSFQAGTYDLIVASHVLHATEDLDASLSNVRSLLKPDGRLLLLETTNPESIHMGFVFGLLKDWWAPLEHEKRSVHSPCLTVEQWDARLKSSGFSGVDVEIPGQTGISSIIFSRAVASEKSLPEIKLIIDETSVSQNQLAKCLSAATGRDTCEVLTLPQFMETHITALTVVVFALEVDSGFLQNIPAVHYEQLKLALLRSQQIIWVTRSSGRERPWQRLIDGLSRTLMSEDSTKKFATLALDACDEPIEAVAKKVKNMAMMVTDRPVDRVENVFAIQGVDHVSRITENQAMDIIIADANSTRHNQNCLVAGDKHLGLNVRLPGQLDTLEWRENERKPADFDALKDNEVLVQIRAIGLSRRDYEIAMGRLDGLELGIDISGVVLAAGRNSGFSCGDQVFAILPSMSRTVIKVDSQVLSRFPSYLTFTEAAALPSSLWMAYHALTNIARVGAGETVLICQGASCVGQMALQLARSAGANVIAIASSEEKSQYLQKRWKMAAADIFHARDGSLLTKIMQRTRGCGIDVVLGPVNDLQFEWEPCLASFARVVDTTISRHADGGMGMKNATFSSNTICSSVSLVGLLRCKHQLIYKIFHEAVNLAFEQHLGYPEPLHIFRSDEIRNAFFHLGNRKEVGKRIIEIAHDDALVQANVITVKKNIFDPDASYVVSGGFGGLGRGILAWMASRGAHNLIVLSRSGPKTEEACSLVRDLEARGIRLATPTVDVGDLSAVKKCLLKLQQSMPTIRGCIQATVALRDNLWGNMTLEDWNVGISAKAIGSWNLHVALPADLDFFVLLSSVNGLFGNRAQANYSAGNTFKDALAHHRIDHGQKAVSIDLGLMVDRGLVAENRKLLSGMRRIGHLIDVHMNDLLALMDYYCNPNLPLLSHDEAQVIVGIETPAAVQAKGIDLHHSIRRPLFSHLFAIGRKEQSRAINDVSGLEEVDRASALKGAESDDEAIKLVARWLRTKISQILGMGTEDIETNKPLHIYGIDSLIAIDLRNWIKREIGADVQVFNLLGNVSFEELSRMVALQSRA